jgi:predicted RNase H-like HicB family nuclease
VLRIDFDIVVVREGATFVAYCPELDISSCGSTIDDARGNLKTAVRLLLEETLRMGTLDTVLKEAGYLPDGSGGYLSPRLVATETASIAVGA